MSYYNPFEIADIFGTSSEAKAKTPFAKFAIMAIMGGIFIALGGLLTVVVAGNMNGIALGLVKFTAGALFPVGLIMVSVAGADLFTSDCAGMTLSTMQKKTVFADLLKVWALSYAFNFIGSQLVAYFMTYKTGILSTDAVNYVTGIANGKLKYSWDIVFLKGIGANALVCLGTWMGYAGKDIIGKSLGIWVPVMLFVTLGYEHSIANMFFIPTAIYSGADISWCQFICDNLIPATIGNIVGGAVFIGLAFGYVYNKK
jgi:formate/nitrite transporter